MSSPTTTTTATEKPSSRVQSASNKDKQETPRENADIKTEKTPSRPPSAAQRAPGTAANETGPSTDAPAAEGSFSTIGSLLHASPFGAPSATDTSTELRPGSASNSGVQNNSSRPPSATTAVKAHPTTDSITTERRNSRPSSAAVPVDEIDSHGYSIVTTDYRPSSASQNAKESSSAANSRPPSANKKTHDSTSPVCSGSRPPSASQKTHDSKSPVRTGSRPPSANPKTHDSAGPVAAGSRPPSANPKSNGDHPTPLSNNSRPSTGSQRTDTTTLGESSSTPAPTNSRPPSAARTTGSRPPSANPKQEESTAHHPTTDQSNTSNPFHGIGEILTQPIIGRPPSAAKKASNDETNAPTENKPVEDPPKSPRIGSATKNHST